MEKRRAIEISIAVCEETIKAIKQWEADQDPLCPMYFSPKHLKPDSDKLRSLNLITDKEHGRMETYFHCALCVECQRRCLHCIGLPIWLGIDAEESSFPLTAREVFEMSGGMAICSDYHNSPYEKFLKDYTRRVNNSIEQMEKIRDGLIKLLEGYNE